MFVLKTWQLGCHVFMIQLAYMEKFVRIFTDGGARGNPGPAGSGAVLYEISSDGNQKIVAEISEYLGIATNNQAEYQAIVLALKKAKELGYKSVEMFMDSELAVKQINGEYKVKNEELAKKFLEIYNLRQSFDNISFTHVRRDKNKEADAQVNEAIDANV